MNQELTETTTAQQNHKTSTWAIIRQARFINEVLSAPELQEPDHRKNEIFNKEIVFQNVSFSYEETKVLKNISFVLPEKTSVDTTVHSTAAAVVTIVRVRGCRADRSWK